MIKQASPKLIGTFIVGAVALIVVMFVVFGSGGIFKTKIDYVIYFSRTGQWGYITPAFTENRRRLNSPGHIRFHNHQNNFLKAWVPLNKGT